MDTCERYGTYVRERLTDLVRISSNILFSMEWETGEGARYRNVLMEY